MRLTVTLPDIERGFVPIGGAKDRRVTIEAMARRREPFAITPVRTHEGKTVSAIATTGEVTEKASGTEIVFRPVWCKVFTSCSMRKDTVIALVCEFEFGKYWIDRDGIRKADLTTGGNGTDPAVVQDSELVLGRMLDAPERSNILDHMIDLIKRSF